VRGIATGAVWGKRALTSGRAWVADVHRYPKRDRRRAFPSRRSRAAMPPARAQRRQETVTEGEWADLPDDLMAKVLELLLATGWGEPQEGGFGFSQATATARLVCSGWKAVHDALVMRLVLSRRTTDEAMGMLVRRFPAVVSLEFKGVYGETTALTDKGLQAVSIASLTSLDLSYNSKVSDKGLRALSDYYFNCCNTLTSLNLTYCISVTDKGLRAVSNIPALTSLNLTNCRKVSDEGLRAVSSLLALTSLEITGCFEVTNQGLRAVAGIASLTRLCLTYCDKVTDEGVRAMSIRTALTELDLTGCVKVTDEGLRAVAGLTSLTHLSLAYCTELTDEGLRAVAGLTSLTALDLTHCDTSQAAEEELCRQIPGLFIEREEESEEEEDEAEDWEY
jgi:hypothetical protein